MGVHIRDVCEQLQKIGVDNTVMCISHNQLGQILHNFKGYNVLKVFNENIYNYNQYDGMIDDTVTEQVFYINFAKHLKNESFELIHLHDSQLFNVARFLSIFYECPLIMTCHLSLFLSHPSEYNEKFKYLIKREGKSYHYCNKLMTVSDYYKTLLEDNYLLKNRDISVVYNGVNYEELNKIKYNHELRQECLGNKDKIIGFVGRMVNTKGIKLILEAAEELPNYQFNLICNVLPTMEAIVPIIKQTKKYIKTHDNLKWYKSIPDDLKWDLMKISDLGIVPSLHEPFGIVALEWMSLHIPLLTTAIEGLGDFCKEGFNSIVIKATSESLINKLKNYEETYNINYLIRNGTETAKSFSWLAVANKYKRIYEGMIKNDNS